MQSTWESLKLKESWNFFAQETMAADENRFAKELNEKEAIELLENATPGCSKYLSNILGAFLKKQLFHSRLLDMRWLQQTRRYAPRWLSIISYPTRARGIIVKYMSIRVDICRTAFRVFNSKLERSTCETNQQYIWLVVLLLFSFVQHNFCDALIRWNGQMRIYSVRLIWKCVRDLFQ